MQLTICKHIAITLLVLSITQPLPALPTSNPSTQHSIDWPAFLGRNNMNWPQLPTSWNNGAYIGNGLLGTIFWQNKEGALQFEISRTDVYDHRNEPSGVVLYNQYRMPNGHFELTSQADKPTGSMQLDLWNAQVTGQLSTKDGKLKLRTFTDASTNCIVLETTTQGAPYELTWHPELAKSYRTRLTPKDYAAYPAQTQKVVDGIQISVQDLIESKETNTIGQGVGQYATAWTTITQNNHRITYISMGFSYPGTTAVDEAVANVKKAVQTGLDQLEKSHQQWWHDYYQKSFLSIPDPIIESFYWAQLYKMGSATRQHGVIIDLEGPWYQKTTWPAIWWNLNIQLTYWPFYTSNHVDAAEPLIDILWKNRASLAANAAPFSDDSYAIGRATGLTLLCPVGTEVGNLPWVMHNLWLHYRNTMDDALLRDRIFPLMKGTFNYLSHTLKEGADGKLHLPITASPEYIDAVEECNYTAACVRWLATTIIQADARLQTNDPMIARCKEVLDKLAPYQIDDNGFMVGKDVPFAHSHRHWSHLFMVYPFHEYSFDNPAQAPLIQKSLEHFLSMPNAFAGYSRTSAAAMFALQGDGDEARNQLRAYLKMSSALPNALYHESGPVIETPLAFARSLQEMMLTSHGDLIRVFPAAPKSWPDIAFDQFRAEGAFLVTAKREKGITQFVKITSEKGEPCKIRTSLTGKINVTGNRQFTIKDLGNGEIEIDLKAGETAILYTGDTAPDTTITPIQPNEPAQPWGLKKPKM